MLCLFLCRLMCSEVLITCPEYWLDKIQQQNGSRIFGSITNATKRMVNIYNYTQISVICLRVTYPPQYRMSLQIWILSYVKWLSRNWTSASHQMEIVTYFAKSMACCKNMNSNEIKISKHLSPSIGYISITFLNYLATYDKDYSYSPKISYSRTLFFYDAV